MCLAIPALLIEMIGADQAVVDLGGIRKQVSTALVPD
ncbi:MAG: hydrogenase formation protein HypC, partial [Leptothrix sp. (in: Bacteria)]|nr:hydrogenase formation protein HypC [Leptothrix sp. (in: b-proteobacteria)]